MDLPQSVIDGLGLTGDSVHIADKQFKRLIDRACSGVLEPTERNSLENDPMFEKVDKAVLKEVYASIVSTIIEAAKQDVEPASLRLAAKQDVEPASLRLPNKKWNLLHLGMIIYLEVYAIIVSTVIETAKLQDVEPASCTREVGSSRGTVFMFIGTVTGSCWKIKRCYKMFRKGWTSVILRNN
ncbi:hypothetical protein KUTeg_008094 [Tegillarca granosa]|uniref:Uncharacterized protein n=1 Tax=Tegillarca granosa TaxID=220873 RepID=A0ABQ9F852_TEGGR|nr:hypothetical protein KUTeg_008094 [Tegillarca granosa]